MENETWSPAEQMTNFLEKCLILAAGTQPNPKEAHAMEVLREGAEIYCPDITDGAKLQYGMEANEIQVETPRTIYRIAVRAVER